MPVKVIQLNHENARRAEATLQAESVQLVPGPRTVYYNEGWQTYEHGMGLTVATPAPMIQKNQRMTSPAISAAKIPK